MIIRIPWTVYQTIPVDENNEEYDKSPYVFQSHSFVSYCIGVNKGSDELEICSKKIESLNRYHMARRIDATGT